MKPDLGVAFGGVALPNPVMVASGTAGHSTELADAIDLSGLGAFVVKSLATFATEGNPAPRLHPIDGAMLNSIGLAGPGIASWMDEGLNELLDAGVQRIVVSIWGRTIDEYHAAAQMLADAPDSVIAVEVNLSCPNLDGGKHLFAHDAAAAAEIISGCQAANRPLWAKLSANTDQTTNVAHAVRTAGAAAVTLINTLIGLTIDVSTRKPTLGAGRGGLSGNAIRPVALRAVYDCYASDKTLPIIGVGGISSAEHAVAHILAGASAIQVGTATFANPSAPQKVLEGLTAWCEVNNVNRLIDIRGGAHEHT